MPAKQSSYSPGDTGWWEILSTLNITGMMKKNEGAGDLSQYEFAKKPEELSFLKFLYNDSTGEVLGRSASSWGEDALCSL